MIFACWFSIADVALSGPFWAPGRCNSTGSSSPEEPLPEAPGALSVQLLLKPPALGSLLPEELLQALALLSHGALRSLSELQTPLQAPKLPLEAFDPLPKLPGLLGAPRGLLCGALPHSRAALLEHGVHSSLGYQVTASLVLVGL